MSRDGSITLDFGGEEREFRLAIPQLRKLQEKCDAGPSELAHRIGPYMAYAEARARAQAAGVEPPSVLSAIANGALGTWRVDDVRETIFQGLIGGGLTPNDAGRLVRDWFDARPLIENLPIAFAILVASIAGVEDEPAAGEPLAREVEPLSRAAN